MNRNIISGTILTLWPAILTMMLFTGCSLWPNSQSLNKWVAPSSDHVWNPPAGAVAKSPPVQKETDIPKELLQPGAKWKLTDIIEIALRNNPQTRSAWYAARSAAADWMSQKGNYYPQVNATTSVAHINTSYSLTRGGQSVSQTYDNFQPAVAMSWLLLDFGGRDAAAEEKRQALLAADFTHNAAIQDSVFLVIQTYFQYASAKALAKSAEASLTDAQTNLEAAQQRHDNGLATIADVLQARTAVSRAKLTLDEAVGQVQTIRGALATAMGIPANTPYDIADLKVNPKIDQATQTVDEYIKQAQTNRPDLAAQKSLVEKSLAHIRTTGSQLYPTLSLTDNYGLLIDTQTRTWEHQNNAALMVNIPIFEGYSSRYNELKAKEDAETQKADLQTLEQTIILQVWSSYFNLKTADQQVKTSGDLLESAQQSHDVALGRYKEGVGGFLDLLAAQSALASARAQRITALANWYISLTSLAYDTGTLWNQKPGEPSIIDKLPATTIKEDKQP